MIIKHLFFRKLRTFDSMSFKTPETIKALMKPLSQAVISQELKAINSNSNALWTYKSDEQQTGYLRNNYKFKNYVTTWEFLGDVARAAHRLRHHPTILTTYNKVELTITTHDAGNNVTTKDLELADAINQVYFKHVRVPQKTKEFRDFLDNMQDATTLSHASKMIETLIDVNKDKK